VDLILNVHSLYIFHKNVLTAPRFGAFNLHPGPLPRYAGLNSISWALYHGEKTHGVTIHRMEPEIDSGPIVYQSWFPIAPQDTAFSLGFKCVKAGLQLVNKLLETMASDATKLPLTAQDLSKREYFPPGPPQGGRLSWFSPAEKIVNYVRASDYFPFRSPWGHPRSRLGEREIAIAKAEHTDLACSVPPGTVGERSGTGALVAALDKWVLVRKVKIGDRYWAAGDILSPGYRLTMWPRARPQEIAAEIPFVSRGCLRGQG
jgi:methionyl-tRNA formyltransferase